MNTSSDPPPSPITAPVAANLYQLLAPFTGYRYMFLLGVLKDPDKPVADVARAIGVTPEAVYNWNYVVPGFREALAAIKEGRADLRTEYAKLAFLEATPRIADAMVKRAQGKSGAAQRAGERILEATGGLPKSGEAIQPASVQVVTHTYVQVQREGGQGGSVTIIGEPNKELPPGDQESDDGKPGST